MLTCTVVASRRCMVIMSRFARNVHARFSHVTARRDHRLRWHDRPCNRTTPALRVLDRTACTRIRRRCTCPAPNPCMRRRPGQQFQLATTPLLAQLKGLGGGTRDTAAGGGYGGRFSPRAGCRFRRLSRPLKTLRALESRPDSIMALYLGLISGTSMDAIDAVARRLRQSNRCAWWRPRVPLPFDPESSRQRISGIDRSCRRTWFLWMRLGKVDVEIGRAFAQAVAEHVLAAVQRRPAPSSRHGHRQPWTDLAPSSRPAHTRFTWHRSVIPTCLPR